MRNIKEDSEVNWNYVLILDEFLTYFEIDLIKEFSLISRFLRNKLKPKLFDESALSGQKLINYFDLNSLSKAQVNEISAFTEYWKNIYSDNYEANDLIQQFPNSSDLMFLAKDLKRELQRISEFIKSLNVFNLTFYFYDLYSITLTLHNLVNLELIDCYIPLFKFMRIGEYLKNLVKLSLTNVTFIELNKQELSPEMLYFPHTLKHLKICHFHINLMDSKPDATHLFTRFDFKCVEPKLIQRFNISNLKRMEYHGGGALENVFFELLKSSPQVETLIIGRSLPNQRDYNQISISKHLTNLEIRGANIDFPHISDSPNFIFPRFDSVNKLTLEFRVNQNVHNPDYRNITKYFPNLTHLAIGLDYVFGDVCDIVEFFDVNLPFCNTLEVLTIWDEAYGYDIPHDQYKFNFENFVNIKCLILDLDKYELSQIDFNKFSSKVQQVRKLYHDKQHQLDYIRDNPERFRKWNIEFKGKYIYFNKKNLH